MLKKLLPVLCVLFLALASCARVKPYQRETHAKKSMQPASEVERKLDEHVEQYREGSVGGGGAERGGCGCN